MKARAALLAAAAVALAPAVLAQTPAPKPMPKDASWSLRAPKDEAVHYRGALILDRAQAGGAQGMLYPAPNVAGFLAAIITHAVIADSAQSAQKTKMQEDADRVLAPYRPVLAEYKIRELMQKGLARVPGAGAKLVEAAEDPGAAWLVESTPVFTMTQDQTAIVLENAVVIYAPGNLTAPAYQNVVRVVSRRRDPADISAFWLADQGTPLKDESVALFGISLDMSLADAAGLSPRSNVSHRTFRYPEGSREKMERALLMSEHCDRVVIRNLRGWLMSVPVAEPVAGCPEPAPQKQ